MKRMPYLQFYHRDWISDTRTLTLDERGAWIDLICFIWDKGQNGKISISIGELSALWGLQLEAAKALISSLSLKKICEIYFTDAVSLTVISRRIKRDEKSLESNRKKQRAWYYRHRNEKPNPRITDRSQKSEFRSQNSEVINNKDVLSPKISKAFQKPGVLEISGYCQERKNQVDPNKFFNYYESNGWRVGRNPMKNWQAAVRTWEKNHGGFNGQQRADAGRNKAIGESERADSKYAGVVKTLRVGGNEAGEN